MRRAGLAAALAALSCGPVAAHDATLHAPQQDAAARADAPFPLAIHARFDLIDQTGARRTEADFAGAPMLVFFGYASCESICTVALPRMAEALDLLGAQGARIAPVLITVDPARDTPQALAEAARRIHPRLIGLTGSESALAAARAAFQVRAEEVFRAPDGAPVLAHGGFIYLVDAKGDVASILPPVLGPGRIAEIIRRHL